MDEATTNAVQVQGHGIPSLLARMCSTNAARLILDMQSSAFSWPRMEPCRPLVCSVVMDVLYAVLQATDTIDCDGYGLSVWKQARVASTPSSDRRFVRFVRHCNAYRRICLWMCGQDAV